MSLHSFKYHFQFFRPHRLLPSQGLLMDQLALPDISLQSIFESVLATENENSSTVRDRSTACSIGGLL